MDTKRQWTLLTVVMCLVILAGGWFVLVQPQHSHAQKLNTMTTKVQGTTQQLQNSLVSLEEKSRSLATQESTLAEIARQLPASPSLPNLLLTLDKTAITTGVDVENIEPGTPAAYTGAPVTAPAPSASASAAATVAPVAPAVALIPGLDDIPVVFTVTGGYFQMENFVRGLEGLQRSMLVNSFTLGLNGSATTTATASPAAGGAPVIGAGEIIATINTEVFTSSTLASASIPPTSPSTSTAGASS